MNRSCVSYQVLNFLITLGLILPNGCVKNPVTQRYEVTLMSTEEESRMGKEQNEAILKLYGQYENEELQKYIQNIGNQLAEKAHPRPLTYHFTVIDSAEINAFALPGGYVYVTRGLLTQCNSEAEVAGVIGHEIAHVAARHHGQQQVRSMGLQIGSMLATIFLGEVGIYLQRYIDLVFVGVYQSFGRHAELQADELGQEYAFQGGWDPRESSEFLKTLDRMEHGRNRSVFHGFFASHPETYERIETSTHRGEQMVTGKDSGRRSRNEFIKLLDQIPFGNRPELGEFEDSIYRNAKSGISIQFPENWEHFTSEGTVVSRRPDASYFMQLITTRPKDETYLAHLVTREDYFIKLRELAEKFEAQKRWRRESEERMIIQEIPTLATTYTFQSYLGRFYSARAHFMIANKNLLILTSFVPVNQKHLAEYYFKQVFEGTRVLTEAEVQALQPRKILIHEVKDSDTFESISDQYYGTTDKGRTVAAFNGYISHLYPTPGDLLKVIVRSTEEEEKEKKTKEEEKKGQKERKKNTN